MKKVILLFSLMLTILFSQTVAEVALEYVEPSETYLLTKIVSGGNDYWIVNIDGNDTLLIDSTPALITSETTISDIILTKFREESMVDYKKEQIRESVINFYNSQYPDRKTCEQYTGVDKMPCFDKDTCLKACYAVPICSMIKSEPFIMTIKDWVDKKNIVDGSYNSTLNKINNSVYLADYSSLESSLTTLKNDMEDMEDNGLYSVYGFCKKMNISYNSISSAKSLISDIKEALANENSVKNKAKSIYTLTIERVNFVENRSTLYNEAYMKVLNTFKECEDNYKKSNVLDSDVELKLATASTYTKEILDTKNEGNYRIAISKGNTYYSELNSLKSTINNLIIQRKEVNVEANKTLDLLKKSYPTLKGTKYNSNFSLIKEEVENTLTLRIVSSELLYTKEKMVEYNDQIKEMVSDCVLNNCEIIENVNEENETELEQDNENETENNTEIPDDVNVTDDDIVDTRPPQPLEIISQQVNRAINFVKRTLCTYLGFC